MICLCAATTFRSDFDDELDDEPVTSTNINEAIIAGCRRLLLTNRCTALVSLRDGFSMIYLQLQLAAIGSAEYRNLLEGKLVISAEELLACFDWGASKKSFSAVGSLIPASMLRELIMDEGVMNQSMRLYLLEWCTGLSVLPAAGLQDKITLDVYDAAEDALPCVHTCTRELHIPLYSSLEQLVNCFTLVLTNHRNNGFQIE